MASSMSTQSGVARAQADGSGKYQIEIQFKGLVTFVPREVRLPDGRTVKELWALLPAANDLDWIAAAEQLMPKKRRGSFRPHKALHQKHHALMTLPASHIVSGGNTADAALYLVLNPKNGVGVDIQLGDEPPPANRTSVQITGFDDVPQVLDAKGKAHACRGCLSDQDPASLPNDVPFPLSARLAFRDGETVSVLYTDDHAWTYSETVTPMRDSTSSPRCLPDSVVVRSRELQGSTTLTITRRDGSGATTYVIDPKGAKLITLHIENTSLADLFEAPEPPHSRDDLKMEHFKLAYLLAPHAPSSDEDQQVYKYQRYIYPKGTFDKRCSISPAENADPFCTPPSQMDP